MSAAAAPTDKVRCLLIAVTASVVLHALLIVVLCLSPWEEPTANQSRQHVTPVTLQRLAGSTDSGHFRNDLRFEDVEIIDSLTPVSRDHVASDTIVVGPAPGSHSNIGAGQTGPSPKSAPTGPLDTGSSGGATPSAGGGTGSGSGWFAGTGSAQSVVFVLDRSVSMGLSGGLQRARAEVSAALRALPPTAQFQVVLYNRDAEPLPLDKRGELLPATADLVAQASALLQRMPASGGTDHVRTLRRGLNLHPELLILVTDADDLTLRDVEAVTRGNERRTVICVVAVGGKDGGGTETPLQRLAHLNRGECKCVTVH